MSNRCSDRTARAPRRDGDAATTAAGADGPDHRAHQAVRPDRPDHLLSDRSRRRRPALGRHPGRRHRLRTSHPGGHRTRRAGALRCGPAGPTAGRRYRPAWACHQTEALARPCRAEEGLACRSGTWAARRAEAGWVSRPSTPGAAEVQAVAPGPSPGTGRAGGGRPAAGPARAAGGRPAGSAPAGAGTGPEAGPAVAAGAPVGAPGPVAGGWDGYGARAVSPAEGRAGSR